MDSIDAAEGSGGLDERQRGSGSGSGSKFRRGRSVKRRQRRRRIQDGEESASPVAISGLLGAADAFDGRPTEGLPVGRS